MATIEEPKVKVLEGREVSLEEALALSETEDEAAGEITRHFGKPTFNPCSIINARAGNCSEKCKWCAQSGHYHTDSDVHGIIPAAKAVCQAQHDERKGVKRFCQVTSGRSVKGEALKKICDNYRELRKNTYLFLCGSPGLLNREELQQLWDAGMRRYHCNLETAPSYFGDVCTSQ